MDCEPFIDLYPIWGKGKDVEVIVDLRTVFPNNCYSVDYVMESEGHCLLTSLNKGYCKVV